MEKIKLLFVEDDVAFSFIVKESLELTGTYLVKTAINGREGLETFYSFHPDIIVADIEMPVMNGMRMVYEIRKKHTEIPIMFATGHTKAKDVLDGYNLNVDNFIKKPYLPEELNAHIQAVLKRFGYITGKIENIRFGDFVFNIDQQFLQYNNTKLNLTIRGTKVLYKLCKNQGTVVNRKELLNELWGDCSFFSSRSLDVYVNKLRKYLSLDPKISIVNIRGKGLVLNIA